MTTDTTSLRNEPLLAEPAPPQPRFQLRQVVIYALLIMCGIIVLVPFLWMISTSLKTPDQLFTREVNFIPDPIAPENYIDVWERLNSIRPGMTFWRILGNTLFITL